MAELYRLLAIIFLHVTWDALHFQDAINSATSVTRTLSGELADGQRKLLAIAAAGANSNAGNPLVTQLSNGPLGGLHEMVSTLSLSLFAILVLVKNECQLQIQSANNFYSVA